MPQQQFRFGLRSKAEEHTIDQDEVTTRIRGQAKVCRQERKVALYLHIENKICAVVRYEMADNIPLVP